jgi:hypothetical protein
MSTFRVPSENNIAVHAGVPTNLENAQAFASAEELTGEWSSSRLVDTWNSIAGVSPLTDLNRVKEFTDRRAVPARIWATGLLKLKSVKLAS